MELLQKKWIQLYEANLARCERYLQEENDLAAARNTFDRINKRWYSDRIANNPFLSSELQKRIEALRTKLAVQ